MSAVVQTDAFLKGLCAVAFDESRCIGQKLTLSDFTHLRLLSEVICLLSLSGARMIQSSIRQTLAPVLGRDADTPKELLHMLSDAPVVGLLLQGTCLTAPRIIHRHTSPSSPSLPCGDSHSVTRYEGSQWAL